MTARVHPYKGATMREELNGIIDNQPVRVRLYTDCASDGYKSDFTPRPVAWVEAYYPQTKRRNCKRFGGKNYTQAAKTLEEIRELIAPKEE